MLRIEYFATKYHIAWGRCPMGRVEIHYQGFGSMGLLEIEYFPTNYQGLEPIGWVELEYFATNDHGLGPMG